MSELDRDTFAPSDGSQPLGHDCKTPVRRSAARCSQPAPPDVNAALNRRISEARLTLDVFKHIGASQSKIETAERVEAELVALWQELFGTLELAGPAGNAEVRHPAEPG
jgi:hypothetical protein